MNILYIYECECGNEIPIYQKITDPKFDTLYCPKCGSIRYVKRLIGSSGFVLKDDGWADTGYTKEK